jgi:hypothetical protein
MGDVRHPLEVWVLLQEGASIAEAMDGLVSVRMESQGEPPFQGIRSILIPVLNIEVERGHVPTVVSALPQHPAGKAEKDQTSVPKHLQERMKWG